MKPLTGVTTADANAKITMVMNENNMILKGKMSVTALL
jgi:hypothetical protein